MPLRKRHHVIDLCERHVVADAVIATVSLQRQQYGLAQARELHSVRQSDEIPRTESRSRIRQRHQSPV
jgi:hypothetical protein